MTVSEGYTVYVLRVSSRGKDVAVVVAIKIYCRSVPMVESGKCAVVTVTFWCVFFVAGVL